MQKLLIKDVFFSLIKWIEFKKFKGWDPYDGLNSRIFKKSPFRHARFFRLLWIQFFKISPLNLRVLFKVPREYNAKGLGLILTGYCNMYKTGMDFGLPDSHACINGNYGDSYSRYNSYKHCKDETITKTEILEKIHFLVDKLIELKSEGFSGSCWGYNFDWQARAFFQPKYTPTVVATSFIANSLLDAFEILNDEKLLSEARSACDFVLTDLNRTYDENGNFCFSYSPLDKTQVFNASLLGSRLLARVYSYTKENELKDAAEKSIDFCIPYQKERGAWPYGTLPYHQWVDSFHTGYMIECIYDYQHYTGESKYNSVLELSIKYYLNNFFENDGRPRYYDDSCYPIDIHAPAQLVVTLYKINKLNENKALVDNVLEWVVNNMWNEKGYFYFQKRRLWGSKIPYMRWAQAWIFYSLSFYLRAFSTDAKNHPKNP